MPNKPHIATVSDIRTEKKAVLKELAQIEALIENQFETFPEVLIPSLSGDKLASRAILSAFNTSFNNKPSKDADFKLNLQNPVIKSIVNILGIKLYKLLVNKIKKATNSL